MQKKKSRLFLFCILIPANLLSGCAGQVTEMPTLIPTAIMELAPVRKLESVECRTPNPALIKMECYDLLVPEDRSRADSEMLRLHVAIFKTKSSSPASDPVLFFSGGPGQPGIPFVMYTQSFSGFAVSNRDVIVVDQRGTGQSQPNLDCPEVGIFYSEVLDQSLTGTQALEKENEAWLKCRARLVAEGIQLNAYNSAASAEDAEDLRRALGIEQWNLFGISYGTRLALTMMRDFPQSVRSAVLDSVYPLPETLAGYKLQDFRGKGSIRYLLTRCAADPECNRTYPDLENALEELVASLNKNPVEVGSKRHTATGWSNGPKVILTGDRFLTTLLFMMYSVDAIPYIPKVIFDTKNGDLELVSRYVLWPVTLSPPSGMGRSVSCVDNAGAESLVPDAVSESRLDEFAKELLDFDDFEKFCQKWASIPPNDLNKPPFTSDIPALLLAGEYDPATPVEFVELAQETLRNSYLYEFPGFGHSLTTSDASANGCVGKLMLSFWNEPTAGPDDSCVSNLKLRKFITE